MKNHANFDHFWERNGQIKEFHAVKVRNFSQYTILYVEFEASYFLHRFCDFRTNAWLEVKSTIRFRKMYLFKTRRNHLTWCVVKIAVHILRFPFFIPGKG